MIYRDGAPVEILAARDIGQGLEVRLAGRSGWIAAVRLQADGGAGEIFAAARRVCDRECRLCGSPVPRGRALCGLCDDGGRNRP